MRFFNLPIPFKELGIPESEVFVDTTGGTVPMSIGAFQAAEERNLSSIYVIGKDKGKIKDWKKRQDGIPVYISDHSSNNV